MSCPTTPQKGGGRASRPCTRVRGSSASAANSRSQARLKTREGPGPHAHTDTRGRAWGGRRMRSRKSAPQVLIAPVVENGGTLRCREAMAGEVRASPPTFKTEIRKKMGGWEPRGPAWVVQTWAQLLPPSHGEERGHGRLHLHLCPGFPIPAPPSRVIWRKERDGAHAGTGVP